MAVIDIGGYSVKALKKNKAYDFVLPVNCVGGTFTLPFADAKKLSHTLERVKKEARISECDLVLPDQWARQLFVKIVNDEPQADVNKDYVIWRSKDQIREEVYAGAKIDAHITSIETGDDKKQHISAYLCLVKYEILNKITDIFAENGIIINSIELSSHAVYNYLSSACMLVEDFALLNIGYEVCTVYFFKNYQPVYVRIIETAGRHFENELRPSAAKEINSAETPEAFDAGIKQKEKNTMDLMSVKLFPDKADVSILEAFESKKSPVMDNFLKEIHLTFEFFASKFPQIRISKAFLSGGLCKNGGLDFFLSNFLSLEAVYASDRDKIQYLPLYAMKERQLHG